MSSDLLHAGIKRKLRGLRRSLRLRLTIDGLAWLAISVVAIVFVSFAVDYTMRLDRPLRAFIIALGLAWLAWAVWKILIRPMIVPMKIPQLALLVENKWQDLGDRLISTIQFSKDDLVSEAMVRKTAEQANEMAGKLNFKEVVERKGMIRSLQIAAIAVALLTGFGYWQLDLMRLWFQRNVAFAEVDWPQDTYLKVLGGPDFIVMRGEDIVVYVSVEDESDVPPHIALHARYPSLGMTQETLTLADREKVESLQAQGVIGEVKALYMKEFNSVSEPFEFFVTGGDDKRDRRRSHHVRIVEPPDIRRLLFTVEYPNYMRRQSRKFSDDSGMLTVPLGSTVMVQAWATKDLGSATISIDGDKVGLMDIREYRGQPREIIGRFEITGNKEHGTRTLKFDLVDTEGYVNKRGGEYAVRIQPDTPPSIDVKKRAVGSVVTPQAVIPLVIQARDDSGVSALRAVLSRSKERPTAEPEDIAMSSAGEREIREEYSLDLQPYLLEPDETIVVRVDAVDILPKDLGGPNIGKSGSMTFRVVTPEDLMTELIARQNKVRLEFLEVIRMHESAHAKVNDAKVALAGGSITVDIRRKINDSADLQRTVGSGCIKASVTLQAILDEMAANRLGTKAEHEQLAKYVIEPLEGLNTAMDNIAKALKKTETIKNVEVLHDEVAKIAKIQQGLRDIMETILTNMQDIQSRQELANQLKQFIDWSKDILEGIRKAEESEMGDILEPSNGKKKDE